MANAALYKDSNNVWNYKDGITEAAKTAPAGSYRSSVFNDKVTVYGDTNVLKLMENQLVTTIEKSATPNDFYASLAAFKTATASFFFKAPSATTTNYKGWYLTSAALIAAYPAGAAGDWAVVGATDTIWMWSVSGGAWVDTGGGAMTWVNDGTDTTTIIPALNVDLETGGLKDDDVTTAIMLGDASNIALSTVNKTIVGAINELHTGNSLMDAITDPGVNAAVTTAKIDAYSGTVITLTAAGNAQTLQNPTVGTAGKTFIVANNDTSTDTITVNTILLSPGESQKYFWDGSAWGTLSGIDAKDVSIIPSGGIVATNVQSAIYELDIEKVAKTAKTIRISSSGGDYTTIQAALDANTAGGELFIVYPGTYTDDTITFTASNQCVVGAGLTAQQLVTTANANILNFSAFSNCRMQNIKMTVTAATSAIATITGTTGSAMLRDCHVSMTNSNVTTLQQPSCVNITGSGTLIVQRGTVEYTNNVDDGTGSTALKAAILIANLGEVKLRRMSVDIDGANQALATTLIYSSGTGICFVERSCIKIDDLGTTTAAGYYLSGSGSNELMGNDIHINVGTGNGYGVYLTGTAQLRSFFNHYNITDVAGGSYSFFVDTNATIISQLDDMIADDCCAGAGTFIQSSSQADGKFRLALNSEPSLTILNTTKEDIEAGREGHVIFKGTQSGNEKTTLARIVAQHDGTLDDQKGDLIFQTNDGADGDAPTERFRIDSAGLTTFAGNVALGANNLTLTGSIANTANRVLKGWFTDLEVTNAIAGSITGNAGTVTTITGLAPDTATTAAAQPNITSLGTLTGLGVNGSTGLDGAVTINEAGADVDFRVEGVGEANALFVQGSDGNVGIGTNAPSQPLNIEFSDDTGGIQGFLSKNTNPSTTLSFSGIRLQAQNATVDGDFFMAPESSTVLSGGGAVFRTITDHAMAFQTNSVERMRIDNTGDVGIGTTSPTVELDIVDDGGSSITRIMSFSDTATHAGAIRLGHARGTEAVPTATQDNDLLGALYVQGYGTSLNNEVAIKIEADGTWGASDYPTRISFWTTPDGVSGDQERLRIDSDGGLYLMADNLEAWDFANFGAFQLGSNASFMFSQPAGAGRACYWMQNAYYDGADFKYQDTDEASSYHMQNGQHNFRIADNGTADTAISWINAMIIDNSGLVGIGTTSPGHMLDVANDAADVYPLKIRGDINNDGGYTGIVFGYEADTAQYEKAAIHVEGTSANVQPDMHFLLNSAADNTSATISDAVLTLLNNGNVGVGVTAPARAFEIGKASTGTASVCIISDTDSASSNADAIFQFYTNGASSTAATQKGDIRWDESDDLFKLAYGGNNSHLSINSDGNTILTGCLKDTTGDPTGAEGMITINTNDNAIKIYADGAWRSVATW